MTIYELLILLVPNELRLALRVVQNLIIGLINVVEELIEYQRRWEELVARS